MRAFLWFIGLFVAGFAPSIVAGYSHGALLLLFLNYLWPTLYSIPGVTEIRSRIRFMANVDLENFAEPVSGMVLSLPDQTCCKSLPALRIDSHELKSQRKKALMTLVMMRASCARSASRKLSST